MTFIFTTNFPVLLAYLDAILSSDDLPKPTSEITTCDPAFLSISDFYSH